MKKTVLAKKMERRKPWHNEDTPGFHPTITREARCFLTTEYDTYRVLFCNGEPKAVAYVKREALGKVAADWIAQALLPRDWREV